MDRVDNGEVRAGPAGPERAAHGHLLLERVESDPQAWLGPDHVARYGASTEVLIKLLDLDQRLPVHLHPDRAFARTHLGLAHGKTEAWYVLTPPRAPRWAWASRRRCLPETVAAWVADRDSDALLDALQTRVVRPGDAMLGARRVAAHGGGGRVRPRAAGADDLSILLEWQGFAVDGMKDGHLDLGFETALQAVDLTAVSASDLDRLVLPEESIESAGHQQYDGTK